MDIVMYSLGAASKVLGKIKQINLHRGLEDNENALLLNSRMSYPAGCELTPGELSCRLELNRYHGESCRFVGAKLPDGAQGSTQCRHEVGVVKHVNEVPIKRKGVALSLCGWFENYSLYLKEEYFVWHETMDFGRKEAYFMKMTKGMASLGI